MPVGAKRRSREAGINVSLPAAVAAGYYGGVGTLFPLIKKKEFIDLVSGIRYPASGIYV
jgi:hypothetical protein